MKKGVFLFLQLFILFSCGTGNGEKNGDVDGDMVNEQVENFDISPQEFVCVPGVVTCLDAVNYRRCLPDGSGWSAPEICNVNAGERCYEGGGCFTPCDEAARRLTSMGCLFYAVDLDQSDGFGWNADQSVYAIVVANVDPTLAATIMFERKINGSWQVEETQVLEPGGLYTYRLPSDLHIEDTGLEEGKVIRVTSTIPIIAYQFNPIDSANTYTNDASLLLPVSTLSPFYYVPMYYSFPGPGQLAYVSIVGTVDGTEVSVTVPVDTAGGGSVEPISAGQTKTFVINEGELLQIASAQYAADLTGTKVWADNPVAVFAGTECSDIPMNCTWCRDSYQTSPGYPPAPVGWNCDQDGCPAHQQNTCAWCDHIEEQVFPLTTWGKKYVAARVPVRSSGGVEAALWRVLASEPGTEVTITTPPGAEIRLPPGVVGPPYILGEGEYLEFEIAGSRSSPGDAIIESNLPILLVQFIEGQECTDQPYEAGGDPAMVQMVPVEQFLDDYIFLTPNTYDIDYLVVTRESGVQIILDGNPLPDSNFRSAGENYQVGTFEVSDGFHRVRSEKPFGIVLIGYSPYVSYAYVGGMNLEIINPII